MKKAILLTTLLLSQSALANIINADYEARMQNAIIDAIVKECNMMVDLTLVETTAKEDRVDQGVVDVLYTSTLTGKQKYDQNIYDTYDIKVKTWYYDLYDRTTGEWGDYAVESVECNIRF